ncbi:MAG TPA: flagellar hook-associated protein FlgL [Immundisolibacter sp.]|nr:flagellar hook-associated protein FlgL [Immundisolibacter sp.]
MRVSTADFYARSLIGMRDRQSALAEVQRQLGSGLRMNSPVDDPAGAASVSRLDAALAAGDSYSATVNRATAALSAEEGALASAGDVLQRVRELALQGLSASQSQESRTAIATEVRALRGQLLALANSRGPDGEHLFAGYSVDAPPFQETAGQVSYVGDAGQRVLELSPGNSIAVADAGSAVFAGARAGNGSFVTTAAAGNAGALQVGHTAVVGSLVPDDYTVAFAVAVDGSVTYTVTGALSGPVAAGAYQAGNTLNFNGVSLSLSGLPADGDTLGVTPAGRQDMFAALAELAAALELPDGSPTLGAAQANRLNRSLENLDQQLVHVSGVRASVGSRLKAAEVAADAHAGSALQIQQALSTVRDLDYAEAATRLAQNITGLQAAQEAFSRLANLSLFNYLR